jgi:hypothetical protein
VLLVPVALLTDLGAALPLRTYYFRDFAAAFFPLRQFAAHELRQGRLAAWNPYIFEGSFQLPALYPADLAAALWPSPVFVSWLLTLHLPLAALCCYWLARELGVSREGAFVAGGAYALGGLALSSLNLFLFLQALALAPLVTGLLLRGAAQGGRAVVVASVALGLALTTLAVEFVGQAILLGVVLGVLAVPSRRAVGRLALAVGLGITLAGLPLALTAGVLPETVRGTGFAPEVSLGNAVHPAVLLQTLLPNLFGMPQAPAEAWWGGRFFSKGLPYFLSLYVGPLILALAFVGFGAVSRARRLALLALGGLGLWYALGEAGGLATLLGHLPLAPSFRFPSKAMLMPYLVVSLTAGWGVARLREDRGSWSRVAAAAAAVAGVVLGVVMVLWGGGGDLVAWTGVRPDFWPHVVAVVARDAAVVTILAAVCVALAVAVRRERMAPGVAAALVGALALADLVRAGAGLNPQAPASFFEPLPEMASLHLDHLDGGRVFSYGVDESPAFREFLSEGGPRLTLAGTYVSRQVLAPYCNVLDRVEATEATDLTSFVPRRRELGPSHYAPTAVGGLLPWLRNASVSRVVSLDPLAHGDLHLLKTIPAGPPGLGIHVYRLENPWPRAYIACRTRGAPEGALLAPYRGDFEPEGDVVLEGPAPPPGCTTGRVRRTTVHPGLERYSVTVDGPGYLVMRDSYARGWKARVDGRPAPVRRANGKHRAVFVPAGARQVTLRYHPPGLGIGLALSLTSLLALAGLWVATAPARRTP